MGGALDSYMLALFIFMALFGPRTLGDSIRGRSSPEQKTQLKRKKKKN